MEYTAHPYQDRAHKHLIDNPESLLFLEMGLGKTIATLTALEELFFDRFEAQTVLVVAPLRVIQLVWAQEAKKWDHTKDFRVIKLHGKDKLSNLSEFAGIYLINYEGLAWLKKQVKTPAGQAFFKKLDTVIFDESTMLKNPQAARSKTAYLFSTVCKRRIALTGSPTPNKLLDLWNQVYVIDHGKRLGGSFHKFKLKYFIPTGFGGYDWKPKRGAKEAILKAISDITLVMKTEDYLELPKRIDNQVLVELPHKLRKEYETLERELILEISSEEDIGFSDTKAVGAVRNIKLRQFLQGFMYDTSDSEDPKIHDLHDVKIKALREVVEEADSPVLIAFQFRHELIKIRKEFGNVPAIYGGTKAKEVTGIVEDWNRGETPILACHPASVAHGVNLQQGGNNIVWLGKSYNLEQEVQFNARLHRQGQTRPVFIHHILVKDTVDEVIFQSLSNKDLSQEALMKNLEKYIEEKRGKIK